MIDSHVHIIPSVDDGSKHFEQSKDMLEMAMADGVVGWIFTPHYNHFCCQLSYDALKAQYQALLTEHASILNTENTRFGVEVYIDESFMQSLSKLSELPTFENSTYMLVEFNRNAKVETIRETIYELKIRGVKPIIAHVEMYTELLRQPETVKALCDEGAMIQVSASSIVHGKYRAFIHKLVKFNAIDLIASDGHNLTTRKPVMKHAYNVIAKTYSDAWARRLFIDSPRLIFEGLDYVRSVTKISRKWPVRVAVSLIAAIAIILIGFSRQKPPAFSDAVEMPITSLAESTTEATATLTTEIAPVTTTVVTTEMTTEALPSTTTVVVTVPEYDSVVNKYKTLLQSLQTQYTADVERLIEEVKNTRQFIVDKDERTALIEAYMIEAGELETRCDYDVYDVLYDFQNELEKYKYPVSIIEDSRADYHKIKEETKQKYLDEL